MQDKDTYQLAGLDDRERGFSRPIEVERAGARYRVVLRYETVRAVSELCQSQDQALRSLIQTLQSRGYRQLKSQQSFRNGVYLGSQELWVEYADPAPEAEPPGFLTKVSNWFRP